MAKVKPKGKTLTKIRYDQQIVQTNEIMSNLVNKLRCVAPSFGSHMDVEDSTHCHDALVCHRIIKKFSPPGVDTRQVCFDNYVKYDASLEQFTELNLWGPSPEHFYVRKARQKLSDWCKGFHLEFLDAIDLEFTPGESFNSTRGDVSMIAKLFNTKHWTTTEQAYDVACQVIYYHRTLKYIARKHIGHVSQELRKELYRKYREHPVPGFAVFCHLLQERNVLVSTNGARASSVFKNIETDRMINVETFFAVIMQRNLSKQIRRVLKKAGNSLDLIGKMDPQDLHKHLISRNCYATIDFSNASDSVILKICELLFPANVYGWLCLLRSPNVFINDEWYEPYKLSSMGNGFTFEVMSLILYAISCVVSKHPSRVFGDDVIIHNDDADRFIRVASLIGFNTNMEKTFINSPFRESCGAFFHNEVGYLTSYEFTWCESFSDVCVTHNKLLHLTEQETISPIIRRLLEKARSEINCVCFASQKGPIPCDKLKGNNLSLYVWHRNAAKIHKTDRFSSDRYKRIINQHRAKLIELGIIDESGGVSELTGMTITSIPVYVPRKKKITNFEAFISAICTGKRVDRVITGSGRWVNIPAFVFANGSVAPVRGLYDRRTLKPRDRKAPTQIV